MVKNLVKKLFCLKILAILKKKLKGGKKMKKSMLLLSILLLVAGLPLTFGGGEPETVVEESAEKPSQFEGVVEIDRSGWEIGKPGGLFVLAQLSDPKSFNPVVAKETSTTDVTDLVWDNIIDRNQLTLEWEPRMAEKWEISDDEKTVTIYLRKNLRWSDDKPITAEDVIFTMNDILIAGDGIIQSRP
ncbi:MAG: hypothetical protein DRP87_13420 [Spirochaetes bacterium]|nr:MAG: hypothetical protein DRP87_13420 [Spirochaetota bacterium]